METTISSTSKFIKSFELIKKYNKEEKVIKLPREIDFQALEEACIYDTDKISFRAVLNVSNKSNIYLQIGDITLRGKPHLENEVIFDIDKHIFENFCGYSRLVLFVYNGLQLEEEYYYLQIISNKLSSEYIEQLLLYLDSKIKNISFTYISTVFSPKIKNCDISFHQSIQQICMAEKLLMYFKSQGINFIKRNHLIIKKEVVDISKAAFLDRNSIDWLSQNSSELKISKEANLKIHNRLYKIDKILNNTLVNSFEVEENLLIYTYVVSVIKTIDSISEKFQKIKDSLCKMNEQEKNNAFVYVCKQYLIKTYEFYLKKCNKIKNQLMSLRFCLSTKFNIKNICKVLPRPRLTPIFRYDKNYRQLYPLLLQWWFLYHNIDEVFSYLPLDNIARLYEYVCLFQIFDAINQIYSIVPTQEESSKLFAEKKYFWKISADENITLYHEPKITITENDTDLIRVSKIKGSSIYNYYTPDFLIKYHYKNQNYFAILDAKFSDQSVEGIKKYYTEITDNQYQRNTIMLVSVIKPVQDTEYISLNINDIFSEHPVFPEFSDIKLINPDFKFNKIKELLDVFLYVSKMKQQKNIFPATR